MKTPQAKACKADRAVGTTLPADFRIYGEICLLLHLNRGYDEIQKLEESSDGKGDCTDGNNCVEIYGMYTAAMGFAR